MDTRRDVFQAIADPNRRAIIRLLSRRSLSLNEVAGQFRISRPAVSKHVRILAECGLVSIRQQGRERICSARLARLKQVADWAVHYQSFWNKKLDALGDFLEHEKKQRKK